MYQAQNINRMCIQFYKEIKENKCVCKEHLTKTCSDFKTPQKVNRKNQPEKKENENPIGYKRFFEI